jgi:cytochrome c oxidase assembly protein subunit 15
MTTVSRLGDRAWLVRLAWATLLANVGIVLTGGAVRLTGSGLGCPTWPRCTDRSFTPHGALDLHSAIEFGNRTLTFVLTVIAVATFVSAWQSGRRELRRLALVLALSVPAQALLGGVTVLTDLNPWVVSFHLLFSMGIISLAVLYLWRIDTPPLPPGPPQPPRLTALAWTTYAAGWLVLALGTVVTGSGPHAGDVKAPRNGLDPLQISQAHADAVFLFVGLSLGLVIALRVTGSPAAGVAALLVGVELAQGLIGFVQYFTDLPIVLVELHLLGAAAIATVMTWTLLEVREGRQRRSSITTGITRDVFSS